MCAWRLACAPSHCALCVATDEQAALERLLLKYPAEKVAAKRWAKIARELGTRTPRQVASRMQKLQRVAGAKQ
jgi:hypothetical protein